MRIALGIEYNGSEFYGWQVQENLVTVQSSLEKALSRIADAPIKVFCAGRTDTGVHASGQVVHFDTDVSRSLRAWSIGANSYLPSSIAVQWAVQVDDSFHARFKALSRRYSYVIDNRSCRPGLLAKRVTWFYLPLDIRPMQLAATYLLGEHDFSSFRSTHCGSKTAIRDIQEISVSRSGHFIVIEIQAKEYQCLLNPLIHPLQFDVFLQYS